MLKRSVDFALAGLLLAFSFPVIALAAILIKFDSRGPAFFCQVRMGRGFRRFNLVKLRTMDAGGAGPPITLGGDPRITRVGWWLRRLKLDELPQFWNVLVGDMSLVGPRPVIPELTMEFKPAYCRLLEVRPGLTDPATLKYCREEQILALAPDPFGYFKSIVVPDKLSISQAYLRRASVWSDLAVMAKTALVLLLPRWQPSPDAPALSHPQSGKASPALQESWRRGVVQPELEPASALEPADIFAAPQL